MSPIIPELLYHTTLTIVDYRDDASGSPAQSFYVLGTHGSLPAAKAFATVALRSQGFEPDDFTVYEERKPQPLWSHDEGVIVFAKTPAGQDFLVGMDTKTNDKGLRQRPDGTLELPEGDTHLHYVVQTQVKYNQDRAGRFHTHEIEACCARYTDALAAAKKCLGIEKDEFAEYDERVDLNDTTEWPFGEDVLIHAVSQMGENFTVAIKTVPGVDDKHPRLQQFGTKGVEQ
ncbi:hypothetical protein GQ53DRAFT_209967 [Thozetella sp. PMI_491]|nr:hypothetical protein GQ53DRAFT_209967 [Thozetella sp. PMI_491]